MAANKARLQKNVITLQESLRQFSVPTAILCLGALLSIMVFLFVLKDRLNTIEREFETYTTLEVAALRHNFSIYHRGLELSQRFFLASEDVTHEEFKVFVNPFFSYGGFEGFWWVPASHETYDPVAYAELDTEKLREVNAFTESVYPEVHTALEKTKLTLTPTASTPFREEHSDSAHHVALVYPVIQNGKYTGSVIGALDLLKILKRNLVWTAEKANADIYLFHHPVGKERELFYYVENQAWPEGRARDLESLEQQSPFHYKATISMLSDDWQLLFTPTQEYATRASDWSPWLILLCGLIISALIGMFIFSLISRELMVKRQVAAQTREMRALTKDLSESEGRFRAIVDNTIDGLITINEAGLIKSFNPACERIFGYKESAVLNQSVTMLLAEPYRTEYSEYIRNYHFKQKKLLGSGRELKGRKKDGMVFPMELSVSEVQLRDRKIYSLILRDITERKRSESQLQKTADALEESNRELEQFAYVASHDLKAPLRGIDNLSKWLMEDLGDALQGENKENLLLLRGRVTRMERLLDDLLEYSRLPVKAKSKAKRINGYALLEETISLLDVPKGFSVNISDDFKAIEVMDVPLRQVFLNLIGNAIKHHDKAEGNIEVSLEDEGDYYHFRVSDDGPGIPKQFHHRVFQMFQTLKPRDEVEGSGMGLALVEKVVMHQGGEITLISDAGIGTTILFTWKKY